MQRAATATDEINNKLLAILFTLSYIIILLKISAENMQTHTQAHTKYV